ncbi:hypothetical protein SUGI_0268820 [Cryptomeria japonica]|nr:hypothetical protein SUGI_0268820 [Cryptomeria japonica]
MALQHDLLKSSSPAVWDCGSSLYDSYELFTFTQHLKRAIAAEGPLRNLSMTQFALTPTPRLYNPVVKEDVDFSHHSKLEPLHPKTPSRVGVPKLVQQLLTRLAKDGTKSRTGAKQHELHSKVGSTPFERMLYTAAHYC